MKTRLLVSLLILGIITPASNLAGQATSWKQVPIPPLRSFQPKQPKRIQLSNGMVILLKEDH